MKLIFRKGGEKPGTLTCIRPDNSTTWAKINPGIEMHDFAHYVVETELGFSYAFFGIVAEGFDIGDFELPGEKRPMELMPSSLSQESLQTEHIVNLLQVAAAGNPDDIDILEMLKTILTEKDIDYPDALDQEKLETIQEKLTSILSKWSELDEGETLELNFEIE